MVTCSRMMQFSPTDHFCGLVPVAEILGGLANAGEGVDLRAGTNGCPAANHDMGPQADAITEYDIPPNGRKWTDENVLAEAGAVFHDRRRMNVSHCHPDRARSSR